MKFIDPKKGWKTYAVVVVGVALGAAEYFGYQVPSYVEWGLAFLGLGTLRHAVKTQSLKTAQDMGELLKIVLANVTVPDGSEGTTGVTIKTAAVDVRPLPDITPKQ